MIYTQDTARRVDANYLITLAVVAETESISEAANQLGLSQPAVSQQLKQLSEALGERLHVRRGHGVQLTTAGMALAERSVFLLRSYRSVLDYLASLSKGLGGILSTAASNTVAAFVMPALMVQYRAENPGVKLELRSGNSEQVVDDVASWQAELGIFESPRLALPDGLAEVAIGGDELLLVASEDFVSVHGRSFAKADLADLPMVWREKGSGVRNVAETALINAQIPFEVGFEIAGGEGVKEAILSSLGAGFLSSRAVRRDIDEGRLVLLEVEGLASITRGYRVAFHPGTLSIPARNFLALLGHGDVE